MASSDEDKFGRGIESDIDVASDTSDSLDNDSDYVKMKKSTTSRPTC
jgi:hypothetical protein